MDSIPIDLPLSFLLCVFTRMEVWKIAVRWFVSEEAPTSDNL